MKKIIVFITSLLLIGNTSYAGVWLPQEAAEEYALHQALQNVNNGYIELWNTASYGWNQSSWGRWKYYVKSTGDGGWWDRPVAASGWCKIDGDWYYFDTTNQCIMAANCEVGGFVLGADGRMIKTGVEPSGIDYDTTFSYLKPISE